VYCWKAHASSWFILSTSPFIFRRSNSSWRMQVIMPQNCKILALLKFVSTYEKWYFSEKLFQVKYKRARVTVIWFRIGSDTDTDPRIGPGLDVMYSKSQHFGSGSDTQKIWFSGLCYTHKCRAHPHLSIFLSKYSVNKSLNNLDWIINIQLNHFKFSELLNSIKITREALGKAFLSCM